MAGSWKAAVSRWASEPDRLALASVTGASRQAATLSSMALTGSATRSESAIGGEPRGLRAVALGGDDGAAGVGRPVLLYGERPGEQRDHQQHGQRGGQQPAPAGTASGEGGARLQEVAFDRAERDVAAAGGRPVHGVLQAAALEQVAVLSALALPAPRGGEDLPVHGQAVPVGLDPRAQLRPGLRQRGPRQPDLLVVVAEQVGERLQQPPDGGGLVLGPSVEELGPLRPPYDQLAVVGHGDEPEEHLGGEVPLGRAEPGVRLLGEGAQRGVRGGDPTWAPASLPAASSSAVSRPSSPLTRASSRSLADGLASGSLASEAATNGREALGQHGQAGAGRRAPGA